MDAISRLYSCKNEELIPVAKFTLYSLRRDIAEFGAFSSMFNEDYVTETEAKITACENLLEPQAETLARRMITQATAQKLDEMSVLLARLEGYLKLLKKEPDMNAVAFGISAIRKSTHRNDYEGIMKGLKVLMANVLNHQARLETKGMPTDTPAKLQTMYDLVAENRQKEFEILSNRKAIVQNNMQMLNELYLRLAEIYNIGKVLYKTTDPVKYSEYTFSSLLKKVRNSAKGSAKAANGAIPKTDVE